MAKSNHVALFAFAKPALGLLECSVNDALGKSEIYSSAPHYSSASTVVFGFLVARGGIDQGWGCLTLMTLQIINYPGWVTITWEDGIVNRLDYAIIRN